MVKMLFSSSLFILTTTASAVTVEQYLDQVKNQNLSFQSSEKQMEGSKLLRREGDLVFTPKFFFNAQTGYDSKLSDPPFLIYDQVRSQQYSAGVSQQFSFGMDMSLRYNLNKFDYKGIDFNTVSNPYWSASPTLELSIPLWGNAFGRASKAQQELTFQQRNFEQYSASSQAQKTLVEAEITYWRLAASQESVGVQRKALDAARNILSYVTEKKRKNLGEEADVLQAKALTEAYRLQLEQSEIEERAARRRFNFFLNASPEAPVSGLLTLNYKELEKEVVPEVRPGDRADVKATQAQVALARASSQLAGETHKPTLNLYGGYSLFGRGKQSVAISQAGHDYRDTAYVGIKFEVPLNFSATSDAREGARANQRASELNAQYTAYAQELDWVDLTSQFKDAQVSLKLAQAMELAQKSKLENERVRLRQGRTTTYQVLLFEQDYLQAEVSRIRAATQIINLKSQIQLYSSNEEGK